MADRQAKRWRARPVAARLVRLAAAVVPFVAAMAVAYSLSALLPIGTSIEARLIRWVGIAIAATAVLMVVDRLARHDSFEPSPLVLAQEDAVLAAHVIATVEEDQSRAAVAPRVSSACLVGASIALPGGFLLGAFGSAGGDPGLGIALVPVGLVLMVIAVAGCLRSLRCCCQRSGHRALRTPMRSARPCSTSPSASPDGSTSPGRSRRAATGRWP